MKIQEYANQIKLENTPTGFIELSDGKISKFRINYEKGYREIKGSDDYTQVFDKVLNTTEIHRVNTRD